MILVMIPRVPLAIPADVHTFSVTMTGIPTDTLHDVGFHSVLYLLQERYRPQHHLLDSALQLTVHSTALERCCVV